MTRLWGHVLGLLPAAVLLGLVGAAAAVEPGSALITCDRADQRLRLTASAHLDPSCVWTRGVEITASNVTLDCQNARIVGTGQGRGVYIHAPTDTALSNITVRNCQVEGFLNNFHVEREGFRELEEGREYEHGFSNITIEDSVSRSSRGVGIFVNGYVEGVTLRRVHVEGAGSAGVYLEAGSRYCVLEDSTIVANGFRENSPAGGVFTFGGVDFWFWGTGREGLAIDGSRFNVVRNNLFQSNTAGGIYLYKNCGEFVTQRPERWFRRRYGADGNLIENNTFVDEDNGVWIGARMSENILPMDCSDPQYLPGYALDYARGNVVRGNRFENVTFGVRVEDDDATVSDNDFVSDDVVDEAIVVGTRYRTQALSHPVTGTIVAGNRAAIAGSPNPYRWIWGHAGTVFEDNLSLGAPARFCEGLQPPVGPFVMAVAFEVLDDPENPPNEIRELPLPPPLPPCVAGCGSASAMARARLVLDRLDTPPGDDSLRLAGELVVPYPFAPALDPARTGLGLVIEDAVGGRLLDVTLSGGAYDPSTRVGWRTAHAGRRWKFVDARATPAGGIAAVSVKDRTRKRPGLVRVKVVGRRGAYPPLALEQLPLRGLVILDPPDAVSGQCGAASFVEPAARCTTDGRSVRCR